jgi:hypothetical protein
VYNTIDVHVLLFDWHQPLEKSNVKGKETNIDAPLAYPK